MWWVESVNFGPEGLVCGKGREVVLMSLLLVEMWEVEMWKVVVGCLPHHQ